MSLKLAVIEKENVFCVTPDVSVREALELMLESSVRVLPVVENDKIVGLFSIRTLLHSLLPTGARLMDDMPSLSFMTNSSEDLAEKLKNSKTMKVKEHMKNKFIALSLETSTSEALRNLYIVGSPLPVVDKKTGLFLGIVTEQSVLKMLEQVIF